MEPLFLDEKEYVDSYCGCLCRYVRSDTEYFRAHYHNYYEFFLILKGKVAHKVNGVTQTLTVGQLLFIRDLDVHEYMCGNDDYFEFINLAFSKEIFLSICDFLGKGYPSDALLHAALPPMVNLSATEFEKLSYSFVELSHAPDKDKDYVKCKARALLIHIFTSYFYNYCEKNSAIPAWLQITYEKMQYPQNFLIGTKRMYEISGKSREHLTRCLKQYYNTTPTQLVNELRLSYAANLLFVSNLNVTDICYECGFENLSWFYKAFTNKFGVTPNQYRKQAHTPLNTDYE